MATIDSTPQTIVIQLTKGYVAIVDEQDVDLAQYSWSLINKQYARRRAQSNSCLLLHRVILERILGRSLFQYELCDHINGNGLDNRRSNLRIATYSENMCNRKFQNNNTTGYKGVGKQRNKYRAQIWVNRKRICLGSYSTPEFAAKAYDEAAIKYHGEFANLNFPK